MNRTIQEAWAMELREGKYIQGFGGLHIGRRHCPLGVLCQMYINFHEEKGNRRWKVSKTARYPDDSKVIYELHGEAAILPQEVMEWAGVGRAQPLFRVEQHAPWEDDVPFSMHLVNDIWQWKFVTIGHQLSRWVEFIPPGE